MANERRLIDADAEIEAIKKYACKGCESYDGIKCRSCWADDLISWIEDAPKVDAVEVVHCKDCKHYDKDALWCNINSPMFSEEHYNWYEDDFCSIGEKMMDGDGNG